MVTHLLEGLQLVGVLQQRDHTQIDHACNYREVATAAGTTLPNMHRQNREALATAAAFDWPLADDSLRQMLRQPQGGIAGNV